MKWDENTIWKSGDFLLAAIDRGAQPNTWGRCKLGRTGAES